MPGAEAFALVGLDAGRPSAAYENTPHPMAVAWRAAVALERRHQSARQRPRAARDIMHADPREIERDRAVEPSAIARRRLRADQQLPVHIGAQATVGDPACVKSLADSAPELGQQ